uniref:NADH dehydrogenase subunit 6 n=1 Tax=Acropyga guianensis TaxID=602208 RepID=A0A6G5NIX8_9HYME|nr:NADH dehydrogenase subunit 6 [Acropyga guianensis]QBG38618.1 NADH dehydrogenase subunit 6 [Acropyga guianensis]
MTKELMTMTMSIIFFLLISLILINMINLNPIMILINLIIFSMMICMKISMWKSNFMYSIILFLITISGLLILFLYFSSLIANEQMYFKFNKLLFLNFILNYLILMILNKKFNFINLNIKKSNFYETYMYMKFNEMNYQNILNFYEYPLSNFTIICMFYLLISLFSIIKICSIKLITLRKI